ncbi:hypothetical protein BURK1_03651 [Burkholderiales bacterium]|nr:hypothetical protein BURK1_03651 [Burkholderiales bacterium]
MIDLPRRRLLKAGIAGGAALAIAGGVAWFKVRPGVGDSARALDRDAGGIVRAIVPAMLAGALPAAPAERASAIDEAVAGVDRAIAGLPPASRGELAQLFSLLALGVGRRVFAGVPSPWPEATVAEVEGFLRAWQSSGWALKRSAYDALHQLVIAAWYANPRSWPAIGYPGPPTLSV